MSAVAQSNILCLSVGVNIVVVDYVVDDDVEEDG